MNNLFEIRYSPRALSDKEIDNSIIEDIFAIAGSSPSSFNSQPWRFLILDKSNVLYNKVLSTMSNFNQGWAKNASKLIVTLARNKYEHNGKNYKHSFYDLGQSVAYMTLRALEHGIYIRQMGGFDSEKLTELLNVDSNFDVLTLIAMGYLGNANDLKDEYLKIEKLPRTRKPLNEILIKDLNNLK